MDLDKVSSILDKIATYEAGRENPQKGFTSYLLNSEFTEGEIVVDKVAGIETITYLQEEWIIWGVHAIRSIGFEIMAEELFDIAEYYDENIISRNQEGSLEDYYGEYLNDKEMAKAIGGKTISKDVLSRLAMFAKKKTRDTLTRGTDIGTIYMHRLGWMEVMHDKKGIERWWNYQSADESMYAFWVKAFNEGKIEEPQLFDKLTGQFAFIS